MEEGYFFLPDKWNREALRPQNPISKVKYVGVNRFILGLEAISKGYTDPRWLTYNQAKENGNQENNKGRFGILDVVDD